MFDDHGMIVCTGTPGCAMQPQQENVTNSESSFYVNVTVGNLTPGAVVGIAFVSLSVAAGLAVFGVLVATGKLPHNIPCFKLYSGKKRVHSKARARPKQLLCQQPNKLLILTDLDETCNTATHTPGSTGQYGSVSSSNTGSQKIIDNFSAEQKKVHSNMRSKIRFVAQPLPIYGVEPFWTASLANAAALEEQPHVPVIRAKSQHVDHNKKQLVLSPELHLHFMHQAAASVFAAASAARSPVLAETTAPPSLTRASPGQLPVNLAVSHRSMKPDILGGPNRSNQKYFGEHQQEKVPAGAAAEQIPHSRNRGEPQPAVGQETRPKQHRSLTPLEALLRSHPSRPGTNPPRTALTRGPGPSGRGPKMIYHDQNSTIGCSGEAGGNPAWITLGKPDIWSRSDAESLTQVSYVSSLRPSSLNIAIDGQGRNSYSPDEPKTLGLVAKSNRNRLSSASGWKIVTDTDKSFSSPLISHLGVGSPGLHTGPQTAKELRLVMVDLVTLGSNVHEGSKDRWTD